jgi:hypothetical protein
VMPSRPYFSDKIVPDLYGRFDFPNTIIHINIVMMSPHMCWHICGSSRFILDTRIAVTTNSFLLFCYFNPIDCWHLETKMFPNGGTKVRRRSLEFHSFTRHGRCHVRWRPAAYDTNDIMLIFWKKKWCWTSVFFFCWSFLSNILRKVNRLIYAFKIN